MTNDAKRKNFTFRMKTELNDKVSEESTKLGISKTAYITMVLHRSMNQSQTSNLTKLKEEVK